MGGADVLCDRARLGEVGGLTFWPQLPPDHAGEELLAELLLVPHAWRRRHPAVGLELLPGAWRD